MSNKKLVPTTRTNINQSIRLLETPFVKYDHTTQTTSGVNKGGYWGYLPPLESKG